MEKNNFKSIYEDVTPPKEVKENIDSNRNFIQLIVSILELFTTKAAQTFKKLLDNK